MLLLRHHVNKFRTVYFGRNFAEFKFDQNIDGILELGLHGAKQNFIQICKLVKQLLTQYVTKWRTSTETMDHRAKQNVTKLEGVQIMEKQRIKKIYDFFKLKNIYNYCLKKK